MAVTMDQIGQTLEAVTKRLEKMQDIPVQSYNRRALMGFTPQGVDPGWPSQDNIERLKVYDQESVRMYTQGARGGRLKSLLGWGPMLMKMAAVNGVKSYQDECRRQFGWTPSYGEEQLEKEFTAGGRYGPRSVQKARSFGVPWEEKGPQIRKTALAESSGTTGGYLIPPQFQTDLLTIEAENAFIGPRARVQPMNSRSVQWPTLDITTNYGSGVTPYYGGISYSWQPEAALINESEPGFRLTDWVAWDLVLYAVSSNQLLQDNGVGLDAMMTMLLGEAAIWAEEFAFLQGKGAGSSMPIGVLNSPCTILQNRNTASRFLLTDAAAMLSHLQIRSWENACWIMHQSVIPQLIQMVGGGTIGAASTTNIPGNMLVWVNPWTPEGNNGPIASKLPNAFLNGLPLFITEKLPSLGTTGDVMLVDFNHYIIGRRLDTQIDISPHFLFRNNQIAWRVWRRLDAKFWLNNSITDQAGWSISPAVVLN